LKVFKLINVDIKDNKKMWLGVCHGGIRFKLGTNEPSKVLDTFSISISLEKSNGDICTENVDNWLYYISRKYRTVKNLDVSI
jgi:hypothetical protein